MFEGEPDANRPLEEEVSFLCSRFASLQQALVTFALTGARCPKCRLAVVILFQERQDILRLLIFRLEELSRKLTIPENINQCARALAVFCETYVIADDAERTTMSLS